MTKINYGDKVHKIITQETNIFALFPREDRNYREEWGFMDTPFGIIEVWLNPRSRDISNHVIRKNRKYGSDDMKRFFLKNNLSNKKMWNEFVRLMKNYNSNYCACQGYYETCESHILLWWLEKK